MSAGRYHTCAIETDGSPNENTNDFAASAGLYDPTTGIHLIGSMNTPRGDQTATLLPDGTVLIAGGSADGGHYAISTAELFKP